MKSFLLLTCFLLSGTVLYSQDQLHLMLSKAPLPAWVNQNPELHNSQVNAQRTANGIVFDASSLEAMQYANQAQYEYLSSGRLLFNDEATLLLNSLTNRILEHKPAERALINVHAYYSSSTNAIVYPNGLIIIELGLIAQLENQDQLAFVLCHEIAHFLQGDYATSETILSANSLSPPNPTYIQHLKTRETEADLFAYELYTKAGFSVPEILRYFDLLNRNHGVPQPISFQVSLFENSSFRFPTEYSQNQCAPLALDPTTFENSSQNSYKERANYLIDYYKIKDTIRTILPNVEFQYLSRLVIYNCGLIYLEINNLSACIYFGYYLHMTDSTSKPLADLLISKALYQLCATSTGMFRQDEETPIEINGSRDDKFKGLFNFYSNDEIRPDRRGYILQVEQFIHRLLPQELILLSIDWTWRNSIGSKEFTNLGMELLEREISLYNILSPTSIDSVAQQKIFSAAQKEWDISWDSTGNLGGDPFRIRNEKLKEHPEFFRFQIQEKTNIKHLKYVNTQLLELSQDTNFRRIYCLHQSVDPRFDQTIPKKQSIINDSIYYMGSQDYRVKIRSGTTAEFILDEKESMIFTEVHRHNTINSAKLNNIVLIHTWPPFGDSLTISAYNNYCLVKRVFSEIINTKLTYFTIPLAYRTEFDSLQAKSPIRYAITEYSITRKYSAPGSYFTYRQTTFFDLKQGVVSHSFIQYGKGQPNSQESNLYFGNIFQTLDRVQIQPN